MPMNIRTVAEGLRWLKGFDRFHIRPGLERMEMMLTALGRPEQDLRFLHLAGTNGKGSTGAFLARILREHAYAVGVFSSPAMMHELDRIQYNGNKITDEDFLTCINRVERAASGLPDAPTEFEVITALALVYFQMTRPDWIIWETGLGGRWDATNAVQPCAAIITNIGHDHMGVLGTTETAIAEEKAGIIKGAHPVITAAENKAETVIRRRAEECHGDYYRLQDYVTTSIQKAAESGQVFFYSGLRRRLDHLRIRLPGHHQVRNAALSLFTLEVLEQQRLLTLEEETVKRGFQKTSWPGRMELMKGQPRILLDAAHNPEASTQLAEAVQAYFTYDKLCLIIGVFADKDVASVVRPLARLATDIVATSGDHPRYLPAAQLAEIIQGLQSDKSNVAITSVPHPLEAIKWGQHHYGTDDLILVAGSHDLMSTVRKKLL